MTRIEPDKYKVGGDDLVKLNTDLNDVLGHIMELLPADGSPNRTLFVGGVKNIADGLNGYIAADSKNEVSVAALLNRQVLLSASDAVGKLKKLRSSLGFLDEVAPVIAIRAAIYGRRDLVEAAITGKRLIHPKAPDQICIATGTVLNTCQGKPTCTLPAIKTVCNTGDPAPLVELSDKKLVVLYACVPGNADHWLRFSPLPTGGSNVAAGAKSTGSKSDFFATDAVIEGHRNANIRSFNPQTVDQHSYWVEFSGNATATLNCLATDAGN